MSTPLAYEFDYASVPTTAPTPSYAYTYEENSVHVRRQMAGQISKKLRGLSSMTTFGCHGTICWLIRRTLCPFFFYSCYSSIYIMFYIKEGCTVHQWLGMDANRPPFVQNTLQLLAAFLTGLTMSEAVTRYKGAMQALKEIQDSTETLRVSLLSSTSDPKIRIATQCLIAWMMVLGRKCIAFFTQDFSEPIQDLVDSQFASCVLFEPEVIWGFDHTQWEFIFTNFLMNTHQWDFREKTVDKMFARMTGSWHEIQALLQVRTPTTRFTIGKFVLHVYLLAVPINNNDLVSTILLPVLAMMFFSIISFATDVSDPWGTDFHDLPLSNVMRFLSTPLIGEEDEGQINEAIAWFNEGMTRGRWTCGGAHPIPREKVQAPNKGYCINFADMRTLAEVSGFKTFESFQRMQRNDMEMAEAEGRRLPSYVRWRTAFVDRL
eukprot:TRINITY_DN30244_c0_g1_i1.p1 TRINITY_DN30244_c0_g1~~TRINITY_DN30244_c0_g1_i1.p1  ORF type:complete len:433 (-),score=68.55 TRINITY_DN30244_c0_g1_i1:196-1494(-)